MFVQDTVPICFVPLIDTVERTVRSVVGHTGKDKSAPFMESETMTKKLNSTVECADGYRVSIQASQYHYCSPRVDYPLDGYTTVELGFPSQFDELIQPYAEDPDYPCSSVYGYVPQTVVLELLTKHGGVVKGELPPLKTQGSEEE